MYYNVTYIENVLGLTIPEEKGLYVVSESLRRNIEEEQRQYDNFVESIRVLIEEQPLDEGMKDFFDGAKTNIKFTQYIYNLLKQGPTKWLGFWDNYSKKVIVPYKEKIGQFIEKIKPISQGAANALGKLLQQLVSIPSTRKIGWKAIIPAMFVAAIVRYISDISSTVKDGLEGLGDDVKEKIKELFEGPLNKLASSNLVTGVLQRADQIKEIIVSFSKVLKETFSPLMAEIKKQGEEFISQFMDPTGITTAYSIISKTASAYSYVAETFKPLYMVASSPEVQAESKENNLSLIKEELTKTEIKELVRDELKKELKKMVKDEIKVVLKDRDIKNNIGDISKDILKLLYKDLSLHHGYVIDRVRI